MPRFHIAASGKKAGEMVPCPATKKCTLKTADGQPAHHGNFAYAKDANNWNKIEKTKRTGSSTPLPVTQKAQQLLEHEVSIPDEKIQKIIERESANQNAGHKTLGLERKPQTTVSEITITDSGFSLKGNGLDRFNRPDIGLHYDDNTGAFDIDPVPEDKYKSMSREDLDVRQGALATYMMGMSEVAQQTAAGKLNYNPEDVMKSINDLVNENVLCQKYTDTAERAAKAPRAFLDSNAPSYAAEKKNLADLKATIDSIKEEGDNEALGVYQRQYENQKKHVMAAMSQPSSLEDASLILNDRRREISSLTKKQQKLESQAENYAEQYGSDSKQFKDSYNEAAALQRKIDKKTKSINGFNKRYNDGLKNPTNRNDAVFASTVLSKRVKDTEYKVNQYEKMADSDPKYLSGLTEANNAWQSAQSDYNHVQDLLKKF